MGKASSSKKVARAAGTSGGRTARGRTPWLYYLILGLVVVLGSAMVYTSRHHRLQVINAGGTATPPQVGTTWNVGYGIYTCTDSTKGKVSDKNFDALAKEIQLGRSDLSDWDTAVANWRKSSGDAIRHEYEQALSIHGRK